MYSIKYNKNSLKQLRKLNPFVQEFIRSKLKELIESENPLEHQKVTYVKMFGYYRYRAGDYRVFFEIEDKVLIIYVLEIEHRKDAYD